MTRLPLLLLLPLGCSSGKPFHYPLDDVLRLDAIQVKGSHNSYHVETTHIDPWAYTHAPLDDQLNRQGVRQIELDLNWLQDDTGDGRHFEVFHVPAADEGTTCRLFTDCLRAIERWSSRYPGHLPIYIQLEPKTGYTAALAADFFASLESEILSIFPRPRILTPDEIQGNSPTLRDSLSSGWPPLSKLRGRVLFALDTTGQIRTAYTHDSLDLHDRLSFVDSSPSAPYAAIAILNDPTSPAIAPALAAHLLVRTRADVDGDQFRANDTTLLQAALKSGAHFISTDFPAQVGNNPYFVAIPDGNPARCNPVTAPSSCTSLALEDPAFVGSGG